MFISKEETYELTGYDVTTAVLNQAQSIVEAFVGKTEASVDDPEDLVILGKAVAYQAAYMVETPEVIFEQMAVNQISQFGQLMSFRYGDNYSPFVSPMAMIACKNLSWRKPRAITTGAIHGRPVAKDRWLYE